MGFETVRLSDVKLERPEAVPAGNYTFKLQPGAAYRENPFTHVQELNVRFDVVEGDFAGRPTFFAYPDPTSLKKDGKPNTWSAQALKKLEVALGVDAMDGEDTAEYLNRVALNGDARITGSILPGNTYKDKNTGAEKVGEPKFGPFTVGPAA